MSSDTRDRIREVLEKIAIRPYGCLHSAAFRSYLHTSRSQALPRSKLHSSNAHGSDLHSSIPRPGTARKSIAQSPYFHARHAHHRCTRHTPAPVSILPRPGEPMTDSTGRSPGHPRSCSNASWIGSPERPPQTNRAAPGETLSTQVYPSSQIAVRSCQEWLGTWVELS